MPEITTLYRLFGQSKWMIQTLKCIIANMQCVVFIVVKDVHETVWEHHNQDCGADSLDREGIVSL